MATTLKRRAPAQHAVTTPPPTPTAVTTSAHQILTEIQSIYDELTGLSTLVPGDQINSLLTRLVNLCVLPYSTDLSCQLLGMNSLKELCERLRPLCAEAEGELEQHWARRIIESARGSNLPASDHLHKFPYYQNYIDLSRIECSSVEAFLPSSPTNITFIGSGPLPLTSLCVLDRYPKAKVHNIDRDASALRISQELCEKLGYGERMSFAYEDVSDDNSSSKVLPTGKNETLSLTKSDWKAFDVVFLAALVGMDTSTKLAILSAIAQKVRPGTLVVARSAQGLRSVLYPVLELSEDIEKIGFEVLVEVHPWTKVVNSVIVLRVKERTT